MTQKWRAWRQRKPWNYSNGWITHNNLYASQCTHSIRELNRHWAFYGSDNFYFLLLLWYGANSGHMRAVSHIHFKMQFLKQRFRPLLCQSGHAGPGSTSDLQWQLTLPFAYKPPKQRVWGEPYYNCKQWHRHRDLLAGNYLVWHQKNTDFSTIN